MSIYMYFFLENCLSNIYHYTMVVSFIIINMYILKNINKIKILNNSMTPPLGIIACFLSVSAYFRCPSARSTCHTALQRAWFLSIFPHQPVNSLLQELWAVFSLTLFSHTAASHRGAAQLMNDPIHCRIRMRKEHRNKAQARFTRGNVGRASSECLLWTPGDQQQRNLLRRLTVILQLSSLNGFISSTKFSVLRLWICTD